MTEEEKRIEEIKKALNSGRIKISGQTLSEILKERQQLEEQTEDLQTKFDALAEEEFNEEKKATLEALRNSGKFNPEQLANFEEEISGSNIDIFKSLVDIDEDEESGIPEQAPTGSVELPTERAIPNFPRGKKYKDEREMVRSLYWNAYYNKKASPEQIEDAKLKLRTLWETVLTRTKQINREDQKIKLDFTTWQCPKCLRHVINEQCCSCGFCMKRVGGDYATR